jgi:hypothetical protein
MLNGTLCFVREAVREECALPHHVVFCWCMLSLSKRMPARRLWELWGVVRSGLASDRGDVLVRWARVCCVKCAFGELTCIRNSWYTRDATVGCRAFSVTARGWACACNKRIARSFPYAPEQSLDAGPAISYLIVTCSLPARN